jgi:hypothetical protein
MLRDTSCQTPFKMLKIYQGIKKEKPFFEEFTLWLREVDK